MLALIELPQQRNSPANPGMTLPAHACFQALSTLLFAMILLMSGGCGNLSGPDYQAPTAPGKTTWSSDNLVLDEVIRPDWWKSFQNPVLDRLITKAIENNADLSVLAARVDLAEASISQANATRLPTLDAAIGSTVQGFKGADASNQQSYSTAIGWELDIWGKLKKDVKAQKAAVQASEAEWRAGYLELVSNVADAYFTLSQYDEQIQSQEAALENGERVLVIYQSLYKEGMIPQTQLVQQQAETNQLQKDLIELQRLRRLAENSLATLTGTPAGDLYLPAQKMRDSVRLIDVPAGLPSDLLKRRPDIVAAEYRVLQAHHLLGQAQLAKLPSIRLTSNFGSTSSALSDLLNGWNFGVTPISTIPIFDPNVRARARVSKAQAQLSEEEYRRAVIRGFEDVENALVNLSSRKLQHAELESRHAKLNMVSQQINLQLREGMVSQLDVFESERSLLAAQLALIANHRQILSDTVVLFKALGGGWPTVTVE